MASWSTVYIGIAFSIGISSMRPHYTYNCRLNKCAILISVLILKMADRQLKTQHIISGFINELQARSASLSGGLMI